MKIFFFIAILFTSAMSFAYDYNDVANNRHPRRGQNAIENYERDYNRGPHRGHDRNHNRRYDRGSYYDWAMAKNGYGYCYEWGYDNYVLNNGQAVADYLCERTNPSRYNWGRGNNGYGYCFHYTPYGELMDRGQTQPEHLCERYSPSYYQWSRGYNGYACYQYTAKHVIMNEGRPVADYLCR